MTKLLSAVVVWDNYAGIGELLSKAEFYVEGAYEYNQDGSNRWILSHLLRYPILPLIALIAAIINNFAASYVQVLIGRAFDLISTPDWLLTALVGIAVTVFVVIAVQSGMGILRNFSIEYLAQRMERDSRDELYVSLLGKSQTFHNRQRIGDIMARATNDVRALNFMFNPGFLLLMDGLMGIVAPVVLIGLMDVRLLVAPVLFLLFFVITVWDYARQLNPVSLALREQFGVMNSGLAEAINGIEVVKSNAQEEVELGKFYGNAAVFKEHFIKQGVIQARYLPLLVFSIAYGLAFLNAIFLYQQGALTLGQVVGYMGLFGMLRFPTFISIFSFNLVQLGVASAKRLLEMLNDDTRVTEQDGGHTDTMHGEVTFENVDFGYIETAQRNGNLVLKDISFVAEPGQTVAIVGQTGTGKTTLTRLINRIFDAQNGRIYIDGVDVRDWSLESLRSQISTIEQDIFLFSRSIAENIAFGRPNATQEEIIEAAKSAQAHDFIMSFKDGYETEIGERGVMLSGGQRQRLAIARAFLTNPRILILDDSTSAIDSATEDEIQKAMRRISQQRTTFLITHRLSQIRWADQILVLSQGQLVAQGSHEELLSTSPDYQRIFARYE